MDRRDVLLYKYIDLIGEKIKFQKKTLIRTGCDKHKHKLEVYKEIYEELLNIMKENEKAD